MTGSSQTTDTLLHRLREHARSGPERVAFQQVDRELNVVRKLNYGELWQRTAQGAAALRELAEPGDRVLIFFEPGLDPFLAFLSTLAAGMVAVPAALPPAVSAALAQRKPAATRRVEAAANLVRDAEPRVALASAAAMAEVEALLQRAANHCKARLHLRSFAAIGENSRSPSSSNANGHESSRMGANLVQREGAGGIEELSHDLPSPEAVAFLQYTSGSTALPKGVVVTHANLARNLAAIGPFVRSHRESVFISWLPMFHDMGLVGDSLHPLWVGCRCVKLLPPDFLRRPHLWMAAVSKFKGTITGGPNFAYQLAADHAGRGTEPPDLSRLEVCYCGSEPIRAATMDAFAAAYAPHGLRAGAILPCYGMAESTLLVSGVKDDAPFRTVPTPSAGGGPERAVSCGFPSEAEVSILDPETGEALPEGVVGEIAVRSRSVSPGYWSALKGAGPLRFPDEPRTLRTGDLGFLHEGQVYVSGRIKNTLIVRGRKFVAEDVEALLESALAPAVERVRSVVFPVATSQGEEVVVLVEGLTDAEDRKGVEEAVRQTLSEACGFVPRHVHLVRPGSVARTTSGKLQRQFAAELWSAQALNPDPVSNLA